MRASQRYEIVGGWRTVGDTKVRPFFFDEGREVRVTREVANIRDTQGGHLYDEGAYRVKATYTDTGKSYSALKTFYGEVAWSNSRRLYEDIIETVRRLREER